MSESSLKTTRRALLGAGVAAVPILRARAQDKPKLRLGVLTDLSGPYHDTSGPSSVACARQAVTDFNPEAHGFSVEIIEADHQNKPDVGATIARQWFDSGVLAAIDVPNSAVALAVAQVAREKDRIMLNASAATVALTDSQCSPNTIVWSFDTYMLAESSGGAAVRAGGKDWFFITADYAFGKILEQQTAELVRKAGGNVVGSVRYPFPDTADFSAYLQQAQVSGATVLGLANAGADTVNCVKQAHEFGLSKTMKIAPLLMFITDVHAVGPRDADGLQITETFYWNMNDNTRAFTKRVLPHMAGGKYPNMAHASAYAITLHYLKTAAAMGPAEAMKSGRATVARMKAIPTDDDCFGKGSIRSDGRGMFPAFLFKVVPPRDNNSWDIYSLLSTTPPSVCIHPLNPKCEFPVG